MADEFLRTLVEAEIAARDEANLQARVKLAGFPVRESLDDFKVQASSVPQATFDYLAGLEWVRANSLMVGPAGTGKSHMLIGRGLAAVQAGHRVRYFTAADLVETVYRGLADNSVGRVIDSVLRADLVLLDELGFRATGRRRWSTLVPLRGPASERRSLGLASHWPFNEWPLSAGPGHCGLADRPTTPSRGGGRDLRRIVADAGGAQPRRCAAQAGLSIIAGGDFSPGQNRGL
jgi:DNA replication protein DnaC